MKCYLIFSEMYYSVCIDVFDIFIIRKTDHDRLRHVLINRKRM